MLIPFNINTQNVLNCPSIKPQMFVVLGMFDKTNKNLQNVYLRGSRYFPIPVLLQTDQMLFLYS